MTVAIRDGLDGFRSAQPILPANINSGPPEARLFGARVARVEDPALLTGRARFVDDVKLAGMLHGAFMRSPHPHARIRGIDTAAALAMPGVHAVLTARDMPGRLATHPIPT